jgi:hypothetical protein
MIKLYLMSDDWCLYMIRKKPEGCSYEKKKKKKCVFEGISPYSVSTQSDHYAPWPAKSHGYNNKKNRNEGMREGKKRYALHTKCNIWKHKRHEILTSCLLSMFFSIHWLTFFSSFSYWFLHCLHIFHAVW